MTNSTRPRMTNLYKRSIRRLSQLMVSRGLALDQLTPEIAAQLVLRAELARCSTRVR